MTKKTKKHNGATLFLISFILMALNIINVVFNKVYMGGSLWYITDSGTLSLTVIKCLLFLIVPVFVLLSIKTNKHLFMLLSSFALLLANICMLFFKDISNYIFCFVIGGLGLFSSLFYIISISTIFKNQNNAIHIITCFINSIIVAFVFITFTAIIPEELPNFIESLEYIKFFPMGLSMGFGFVYYVLQNFFFIYLLNGINVYLFDACEKNDLNNELLLDGYSNMAKHILMPLSTMGFYYFSWIYKITKHSHGTTESNSKATESVILNLFIPFYSIYWYYKTAKNIEKIFEQKGKKNQSFTTLIIILSIFLPFVAYIVLQSKFNEAILISDIEQATEKKIVKENNNEEMNYLQEIETLKHLMDIGAISQEEYEIKKKQLLGL